MKTRNKTNCSLQRTVTKRRSCHSNWGPWISVTLSARVPTLLGLHKVSELPRHSSPRRLMPADSSAASRPQIPDGDSPKHLLRTCQYLIVESGFLHPTTYQIQKDTRSLTYQKKYTLVKRYKVPRCKNKTTVSPKICSSLAGFFWGFI